MLYTSFIKYVSYLLMCPEGNKIFTIKKVILLQCFLNLNSGFIDKERILKYV